VHGVGYCCRDERRVPAATTRLHHDKASMTSYFRRDGPTSRQQQAATDALRAGVLLLHYTRDLDSYVGLIQTEVMLCLKKMNRPGCGLVNNCLVGCLFCLTCCLFADFCVCLYTSNEGSLQVRLWMAFRLTLVVSFVACPCMCKE